MDQLVDAEIQAAEVIPVRVSKTRVESGKWVWYRFGLPLLFISMAIVNLAVMHARERKRAEQSAAADGGRKTGSS